MKSRRETPEVASGLRASSSFIVPPKRKTNEGFRPCLPAGYFGQRDKEFRRANIFHAAKHADEREYNSREGLRTKTRRHPGTTRRILWLFTSYRSIGAVRPIFLGLRRKPCCCCGLQSFSSRLVTYGGSGVIATTRRLRNNSSTSTRFKEKGGGSCRPSPFPFN